MGGSDQLPRDRGRRPDTRLRRQVLGVRVRHRWPALRRQRALQVHRGWPGAGFSHSLGFAFLGAGLVYLFTRSRGWSAGLLLGMAAHSITDINDTVGTMLAFPFSTESYSVGTWAYAATPGGKYLDARAYCSSFGFVMDALWLVILLMTWRCSPRGTGAR